MTPDQDFAEFVKWVTMLFPSLTGYMKIVVPLGIMIVTVVGVFSNILPTPGVHYVIPKVEDVKATLRNTSRFAYFFARMTMVVADQMNIVIDSTVYRWFYDATKVCAKLLRHFRPDHDHEPEDRLSKPVPLRVEFPIPPLDKSDT